MPQAQVAACRSWSPCRGAVLRNTVAGRLNTAPTITLNLVQLCLHHSPSSTASARIQKIARALSNHRLPSRDLAKSVLHAICTPHRHPAPAPTRPSPQNTLFPLDNDISRALFACSPFFVPPRGAPQPVCSYHQTEPLPRASTTCRQPLDDAVRHQSSIAPSHHPDALAFALDFLLDTLFCFRDNSTRLDPRATSIDIDPKRHARHAT